MQRLPGIFSVLSALVLCLSLVFWGQNFLTAPMSKGTVFAPQEYAEAASGRWGNLFGRSQITQDSVSNYQLKGVVVAQSAQDSAAVISINGKPAQSLHVQQALTAGVTLSEVHQTHVVINEAGVKQRIDLALSAKAQSFTQTEVGQGRASRPKSFSVDERSRRAPIAIPETIVAEAPLTPGRADQQNSTSELPTASYSAAKMQ